MKVVCNIPHAGRDIPDWALTDFTVEQTELAQLVDKLIDIDVESLFSFVADDNKVISNISRIVVDMERYRNDEKEPMAKLGMGLFYEKDDAGNMIRRRGMTYNKCLDLYDSYYSELEAKVKKGVEETGSCFIIDCHSFHNDMHYTGYPASEYPDVCLGINDIMPSKEIVWIRELFENNGYSVEYNIPFAGSIIPLNYLNDSRVKSVMLELNRRIYCSSTEDFQRVQTLCKKVYMHLSNL